MNEKLLEIMACPKCKGDLEHKKEGEKESLICNKCRLKYQIEDDIPIMLVDEAERI